MKMGAWPEEKEEKSLEEQREALEEAVMKAQSENTKVKEQLAAKEAALLEARGRAEAADAEKLRVQEALEASSKAQKDMQNQMTALDATVKAHEQLNDILTEVPRIKTIVATQCNKRKVIEELLQKAKEVGLTIMIK